LEEMRSHGWYSPLVKWCFTRHTAVGCILSPHVYFILFVYHYEVCDHIHLCTWILRYCILVGRMMLFLYDLLLPVSIVLHSEWNGALWTEQNGWYRVTRVSVNQGRPNILWQRSTPIIVGWFVGHTWKNNNGCVSPATLLWIMPAGWRPMP
jgi:hypothetical protein